MRTTYDDLMNLAARLDERCASQQAPLTKRQREIYDFLVAFKDEHGYAPSLHELRGQFGLRSLATVHKHMENLKQKGYIARRWNLSRSMVILDPKAASVLAEAADTIRGFAKNLPQNQGVRA